MEDDDKDRTHLECPNCGFLWKETNIPQRRWDAEAVRMFYRRCPRCNTTGRVL